MEYFNPNWPYIESGMVLHFVNFEIGSLSKGLRTHDDGQIELGVTSNIVSMIVR